MTATRLPLLLAVFLMQVVAEKTLVPLLDFNSPEAADKWQAVNDGVMGGVSDGRFKITRRNKPDQPEATDGSAQQNAQQDDPAA